MRRVPIQITGQHKQHRSLSASNQITQNLFTEILRDDQGKEASRILLGTPGKALRVDVSAAPVRKLYTTSKVLKYWTIIGDTIYEVLNNNTYLPKGKLKTNTGPVWAADNGTHILIVDGSTTGYIYEIATGIFTDDLHVVAPNFIGGDSVVYVGGYFFVIQPASNVIQSCTAPYGTSPITWNALDAYSTALSDASVLVTLGTLFGQLWAFGEFATVIFENTSNPVGFPFTIVSGAPINYGIAAADGLQLLDNSLIWPAKTTKGERFFVRANNYAPQKISSHEVDYQISKFSTIADADSYSYVNEGHSFYCISFPTGNTTLCYDCSTNEWHTRSTLNNGAHGIDRAKSLIFFNGAYIVGDRNIGKLYTLSLDIRDDAGTPIVWRRRCGHVKDNMEPIEIAGLYIDVETGTGLQGDVQGYDPQMSLIYSKDGGKTWSDEMFAPIGKIGEFRSQVRFPRLGTATDWVFEISGSDPVPVTILGAYAEV